MICFDVFYVLRNENFSWIQQKTYRIFPNKRPGGVTFAKGGRSLEVRKQYKLELALKMTKIPPNLVMVTA